jgi:gas vesicle protein
MGRFFSFLAGSLVGSILGVAAIVMLTPVSGKDVRDALRKELSTIIDEGKRAAKAKTAEMEKQLADLRGETAA